MDKQKIIDAIKEANHDVETVRRTLNRISNDDSSESERPMFSRRFNIDLAFRNGLVQALLLSGECNSDDMAYLRTLPNKPALWSGIVNGDSDTNDSLTRQTSDDELLTEYYEQQRRNRQYEEVDTDE